MNSSYTLTKFGRRIEELSLQEDKLRVSIWLKTGCPP
jgi:hypothetical protein